MTQNKRIYAVTGGIGSGKSAVSDILAEEGYPVFSCDGIYAELTKGGKLVRRLESEFGGVTAPDGSLDRHALAKKVFGNAAALTRLNAITHPPVMAELLARAGKAAGGTVFCEVPLLFEGGYENLFDGVIVVLRPPEARIAAVTSRSGLTAEEVAARIRSQYDYDSADLSGCFVVRNDGDMAALREKVKKIAQSLAN